MRVTGYGIFDTPRVMTKGNQNLDVFTFQARTCTAGRVDPFFGTSQGDISDMIAVAWLHQCARRARLKNVSPDGTPSLMTPYLDRRVNCTTALRVSEARPLDKCSLSKSRVVLLVLVE